MATLIDKINAFENLPEQTVYHFNKLFPSSEITSGNLQDEVTIGIPTGPENVRSLLVNGGEVFHLFHINSISDNEEIQLPLGRSNAVTYVRVARKVAETNEGTENTILDEDEMKLEPLHYLLLQYFRGCASPYHTQPEIANKLSRSVRAIRDNMKAMDQLNIISIDKSSEHNRMKIAVNEDWA